MTNVLHSLSGIRASSSQVMLNNKSENSKAFQNSLANLSVDDNSDDENSTTLLEILTSKLKKSGLNINENADGEYRLEHKELKESMNHVLPILKGQGLKMFISDLQPIENLLYKLPNNERTKNSEEILLSLLREIEDLTKAQKNLESVNFMNGPIWFQRKEHASISSDLNKKPPSEMSTATLNKQLLEVWQSFKEITMNWNLNNIEQPLNHKSVVAIKGMLQQFTNLSKEMSSQQFQSIVSDVVNGGGKNQQRLFTDLLLSFRNRMALPQSYSHHKTITSKEVSRWMAKALENSNVDSSKTNKELAYASQPMTKVEQFIVHINQPHSNTSLKNEFIQEFERVIQSSKLFSTKPGDLELQLKLRPANLGDLKVKLMQVNGEMSVKIMVSTQVAKEMIESNLTQIRHMFSPQQVIVEKNENLVNQDTFVPDLDTDDHGSDEHEKENADREHGESNDEEEELAFYDILMNEKV